MVNSSSDGGPNPNDWSNFGQDGAEAMERLADTFAEALARATAVWADSLQAVERNPSVAAPDPDPMHVAKDSAAVFSKIASDPSAIMKAHAEFWTGAMSVWANAAQRLAHADVPDAITPDRGDKRWRDEDWSKQPMFDVIKQMYLLTSNWLVNLVENAEGVDESAKRKVRFFTRQMADAFSPTNFPMTNPQVMRAALEEKGENFIRGMRNLAEDLERGKGRIAISQTDFDQFEVGVNVATTPGRVILETPIFQLIQYTPQTDKVHEVPLLIFPPWINKFYILDLRPENSMVSWLLQQGYQVFLVSWVNPTPELADKTFDDYMEEGIFAAVDAVREQSGQNEINTVGYCIGGTLLASTLAYMGQIDDTRIQSATFFAAQTDFSEAGDLLMFVDDDWLDEIRRRMDQHDGVLDGQTMADTFNMLRANDLVWSFMINNYMLGKDPRPFDLLYWNSDQTRLPKTLHLYYLDQFYRRNALSNGQLKMNGRQVALSDIRTPVFCQASREDHIAPFRSVYNGLRKFGGPSRLMLAGSGHIAGVINHPDAKKYQHWVNSAEELPESVDQWLADATESPGSWWPEWDRWLAKRSGGKVPAPKASDQPYQSIEPAPGRYVKAR